MTTKRAAKYLNGADIGKKFSIKGWPTPRKILDIRHYSSRTEVSCFHPAIGAIVQALVLPEEEVTIYTPPSPTTDDPHGLNTKSKPATSATRHKTTCSDEMVVLNGHTYPGTVARCETCNWSVRWSTRDGSAESDAARHERTHNTGKADQS